MTLTTEVTLSCEARNRRRNLNVLTAATLVQRSDGLNGRFGFNKNESALIAAFSDENEKSSSVCVYPISEVERLFDENIHSCFNGSMVHRNLDYISGPVQEGKCPSGGMSGNILDFCEVGLKISGNVPIARTEMLRLKESVKSISADERGIPAIFFGTQKGNVIFAKADEEDRNRLKVVDTFSLEESAPILQTRVMDKHLLYLSTLRVAKIPLSECGGDSERCESCARKDNPYCSWCSVSSKCAWFADCPAKSPGGNQCVEVTRTAPEVLSRSSLSANEDIYLYIKGLPNFDGDLNCNYSNGLVVKAKRFSDGLVCRNPLSHQQSDTNQNIALSIVFAMSNIPLVSTSIPVLDCNEAKSCDKCLTASSHCVWCSSSHECMAASSAGAELASCSANSRLQQCPRRHQRGQHRQPVRVPNDFPSPLRLRFDRLEEKHFANKEIFCMVSVESAKMKVPARAVNDSIVCDETSYKYIANTAEYNASVSVIVGDKKAVLLENETFILYKCELLGQYKNTQDCSLCMSKKSEYNCAWCETQCKFAGHCRRQYRLTDAKCPRPEIFFVSPSRGPVEGGTRVVVGGINLRHKNSRSKEIKIGGRSCRQVDSGSTAEIECETPLSAAGQGNASVAVIAGREQSVSPVAFVYEDFSVQRAEPSSGPVAGGVPITVFGVNLDIGSKKEVFLDDVPCEPHNASLSKNHLVCYLSSGQFVRTTRNLTVRIDRGVRSVPFSFDFHPNPIVRHIKPLESYFSGGRVLVVQGERFSLLPPCKLVLHGDDFDTDPSSTELCRAISDNKLECQTPAIFPTGKMTSNSYAGDLGLKCGKMQFLLHLKSAFPDLHSTLFYAADPIFFNITGGYKIYGSGEALVIECKGLSAASDVTDVRVVIGEGEKCNVTSITDSQLLCLPSPAVMALVNGGYRPSLKVLVGERLTYNLGHVRLFSHPGQDELISSEVIGAIGAAAALLVFLAIVILIVLKHKSSETEREYKRIQIQMDILEHNVRSECKQAFAELQTDMTDLTAELETSGKPVLARRDFLMKVLYPGVQNHPVTSTQFDNWQTAELKNFEHSLLDRRYLLALINRLEYESAFGVRDKINFASLLSVFLSTRMKYFSDILRILLTDLANRSLNSKHPELMLRRTETIVEKLLTNWLSICLFDYVRDDLGPDLFYLYKAVKYQVEKGPVDSVTQESRYSLLEQGLLRRSCDYSPVNCLVLQRELEEAYETRVLDCDSISQVKSKILDAVYKNTPFSMRPNVDEVDLEWQCGQDAHVILQDVDLTSEDLGEGCKKVNTLRHYGIKNKAVVSLIPKQFLPMGTLNGSHKKDGKLYHLSPPLDCQSSASSSASSSMALTTLKASKTIPEVFLTRMLATKGTLKKFIDDFLSSLTRINNGSRVPCAVKWLFDLYDDSAAPSIHFDELSHAWKSNSLASRLWMNLIKNPDVLYDVEKSYAVDHNLNVIAQILLASMSGNNGSTSSSSSSMGKDSPSHKLLFAREIVDTQLRIGDFL